MSEKIIGGKMAKLIIEFPSRVIEKYYKGIVDVEGILQNAFQSEKIRVVEKQKRGKSKESVIIREMLLLCNNCDYSNDTYSIRISSEMIPELLSRIVRYRNRQDRASEEVSIESGPIIKGSIIKTGLTQFCLHLFTKPVFKCPECGRLNDISAFFSLDLLEKGDVTAPLISLEKALHSAVATGKEVKISRFRAK